MESLDRALDAASDAGATYADARAVEVDTLSISVRGQAVESVERSTSVGLGVRVLVDGAWGYAATSIGGIASDELARTAVGKSVV